MAVETGIWPLPKVLWLGKKDGEWPLYPFESPESAKRWQAEHDQRTRRVWEIPTDQAIERMLKTVAPVLLEWVDEGS
jgi:hypothetical protein